MNQNWQDWNYLQSFRDAQDVIVNKFVEIFDKSKQRLGNPHAEIGSSIIEAQTNQSHVIVYRDQTLIYESVYLDMIILELLLEQILADFRDILSHVAYSQSYRLKKDLIYKCLLSDEYDLGQTIKTVRIFLIYIYFK